MADGGVHAQAHGLAQTPRGRQVHCHMSQTRRRTRDHLGRVAQIAERAHVLEIGMFNQVANTALDGLLANEMLLDACGWER